MLKRSFRLVLTLLLTLMLAACGRGGAGEKGSGEDKVVATAYGHAITKQQLYAAIAGYIGNYGMAMEDIAKEPELRDKLVNDFATDAVMDYVLTEKAADYGYEYTAEEQQKFEAEFAEFTATLDERNKENALGEGMSEAQFEKKRLDLREAYFKLLGYDSEAAYKAYRQCVYIGAQVEKSISDSITVDANAVRAYYDNLLAAGKTDMPLTFTFTLNNPSIRLYCPDGYRYVKSLLLEFPAVSVLTNAEYYANGDTNKLDASIDRDVAYMQDTIDEIRARLKAGEDFDTLLTEYGQDAGMTMEPIKGRGYIAVTGDNSMIPVYREACESLHDTEAVAECATYKGYWFLQASQIVDEGPMPFEEISSSMTSELVAMKKNLQYAETTAALMQELQASGDVTMDIAGFFDS